MPPSEYPRDRSRNGVDTTFLMCAVTHRIQSSGRVCTCAHTCACACMCVGIILSCCPWLWWYPICCAVSNPSKRNTRTLRSQSGRAINVVRGCTVGCTRTCSGDCFCSAWRT